MRLQTDEDWAALHQLYVTLDLSLIQVGQMTHYHHTSISRNFRRRGLACRRRGRRATS